VPELPHITAPGHRVKMLTSTLGFFERINDQEEIFLPGVIQDEESTPEETIRSIKAQCDWGLKIAHDLITIAMKLTIDTF
jgi:hypothetical protein